VTDAEPTFFPRPADFRRWLQKHHATVSELWVGFYKRATRTPSITWPEAVDEALCFGWIDGVRRSIDTDAYKMRFTPRKPRSSWSAVNVRRAEDLIAIGKMRPAGLTAFEARSADRLGMSYDERRHLQLDDAYERELRASRKAWAFFETQPPWYRRTATFWITSAKKEETRRKRLRTLIEDSAAGRTIAPLTRPAKR